MPLVPDRPDGAQFNRNNFLLIRLLLAIVVLYRHSFDLLAAPPEAAILLDVIPPNTHMGRIALCLFMVVSGFLVAHSWFQSAGWRDFLRRRVLRIYPAFLVASVFSAFVAAPIGSRAVIDYLESLDLLRFVGNALTLGKLEIPPSFLNNPYPGQVNGSLWSIRIEFECYLGLVVLGLLGWLRQRAVPLAIFLAMLSAHAAQGYIPSSLDRYAHHLQLATFFMAGTVLYLYRDRIPRTYRWVEVAGLVTLATAVLEIGFVELLPLTGTYLLLYLAYEPWLERIRPPTHLDLSYGIYLYAWPVQQLLVQSAGANPNPWIVNPWTLSVGALIGSGLLACLSWRLIERPALALKRKAPAPSHPQADAPTAS